MANMDVTYDDLTGTATQLRTGQQAIMDQLTSLSTQVDNLVASGFRTEMASGKFQTSYGEFTTGAKQAIEGLEGMASYLEQVARTLQETDQQLAQGI